MVDAGWWMAWSCWHAYSTLRLSSFPYLMAWCRSSTSPVGSAADNKRSIRISRAIAERWLRNTHHFRILLCLSQCCLLGDARRWPLVCNQPASSPGCYIGVQDAVLQVHAVGVSGVTYLSSWAVSIVSCPSTTLSYGSRTPFWGLLLQKTPPSNEQYSSNTNRGHRLVHSLVLIVTAPNIRKLDKHWGCVYFNDCKGGSASNRAT